MASQVMVPAMVALPDDVGDALGRVDAGALGARLAAGEAPDVATPLGPTEAAFVPADEPQPATRSNTASAAMGRRMPVIVDRCVTRSPR